MEKKTANFVNVSIWEWTFIAIVKVIIKGILVANYF